MSRPRLLTHSLGVLLCLLALLLPASARAADPVVRAVLFYSPSCPHCHDVITGTLQPIVEQYEAQLEIIAIDVTQAEGSQLYQAAFYYYDLTEDRLGVPTLVVGDVVLVGAFEIPDQFPGIVERGLESGGIDWPDFPGMQSILPPVEAPEEESPALDATTLSVGERIARDPLGNGLAILMLMGILVALGVVTAWSLPRILGRQPSQQSAAPGDWWPVLLLALIGLGVAGYLAYVETTRSAAICGPVGDCNTVQQSPYARLLGILPIGVLGVLGYLAILAAWLLLKLGPGQWQGPAAALIFVMAFAGTLFSAYLTFLEPFVIGATCAWCLTSALLMTLILLISARPGAQALSLIRVGWK